MGIAATGKTLSVAAAAIYGVMDGKIADERVAVDNLGRPQQPGVMPVPGQS